jgi:hypothetical protein
MCGNELPTEDTSAVIAFGANTSCMATKSTSYVPFSLRVKKTWKKENETNDETNQVAKALTHAACPRRHVTQIVDTCADLG